MDNTKTTPKSTLNKQEVTIDNKSLNASHPLSLLSQQIDLSDSGKVADILHAFMEENAVLRAVLKAQNVDIDIRNEEIGRLNVIVSEFASFINVIQGGPAWLARYHAEYLTHDFTMPGNGAENS